MGPDRWRRIDDLFQSALTLSAAERAAFLAEACGDDDALRHEIEQLLASPPSGSSALTGRRLGPYQLDVRIGVGGMGEVYRARDPRLGRDVAIKILPARFTSDPDRLARFEQEARLLAVLNHPCIGAIYGLEDSDGIRGLVLELIEGETLADRLARGPVAVPEALRIAGQIAEAIEAAHDRGIVHRDLKPANIKITPAGSVKVLDFGLAKAVEAEGAETASRSPTVAGDVTKQGVILGTPAYMSPEQARGEAVDKRTDIWAFGCILYEMLTGRSVFVGKTLVDTIAAVLRQEPDWSRLPPDAPPGAVRLMRRCLEKDLVRRTPDVAGLKRLLEESIGQAGIVTATTKRAIPPQRWLVAAGVLALMAVALVTWRGSRSAPVERAISSPVTRTSVTLPPNQALDFEDGVSPLAISPDGRRLAYVGRSANRSQLYVRSLDAFDARPLAGTDDAEYPFFSPDGEWVAFFAHSKLARVPVAGGSPIVICNVPPDWRGGAWAPDGTIVIARGTAGLMRVSTDGRTDSVRNPDPEVEALGISWPRFLPDGRTLLLTLGQGEAAKRPGSLAVLSLDNGDFHVLGPGIQADYVSPGYLVYHAPHVAEGRIEAVAFDARQRRFTGTPLPVLDGIFRARAGGAAYFRVAPNGTMVFARGGFERTLVTVDRNGRRTPVADDRRGFRFPRISPDGRNIAVTVDPRPSEIWVYDLERRTHLLLAGGDGKHSIGAVWTNDGERVAYAAQTDIYVRKADASAPSELLLAMDRNEYPSSWSPDGQYLVFHRTKQGEVSRYEIWRRFKTDDAQPLLGTTANELNARVSPDGRWMAYTSDESGELEVHIRSFPDISRKHWQVWSAGGHSPVWGRNGRELFFMNGAAVMAVTIEPRGDSLALGVPVTLFSGPFDITQDRNFDVFPDGQRFAMVEADASAAPTTLNVIVNWTEELARSLRTATR